MIINALNSGAKVFMSDFEDSNTPTWENTIQGQINLRDAVNGTITLSSGGKDYALGENLATLLVRPRGWHLLEKHVLVDGEPVSAGVFDFALYMFHNAQTLLDKGSGPYFYLPKMESHLEARLWNDIIVMTQDEIGVPQGSVRATVLIETILAAFEMEEILYELRDHSAGLNCGRWDYIFSVIKKFRSRPDFVLADRALVTMTTHFMNSYSLLAIKTCHKRGAHAIGGMAAQIPIKNDPVANEEALAKVRADKEREAGNGHDGTWVAHPGLVPIAVEAFDAVMPGPNQLDRLREDVEITAQDLLTFVPEGPITEDGLRLNISVGVQYLGAWLNGIGCVPDQQPDGGRRHRRDLPQPGVAVDPLARRASWTTAGRSTPSCSAPSSPRSWTKIHGKYPENLHDYFDRAAELFDDISTSDDFVDFLTLPAYQMID